MTRMAHNHKHHRRWLMKLPWLVGALMATIGWSIQFWSSPAEDARHTVRITPRAGPVYFLTPQQSFWSDRLIFGGLCILFLCMLAFIVSAFILYWKAGHDDVAS
jgi:hypothetical protein